MAAIIIKYQLADGVTREQFEEWVRTKDQPAMRSLSRVDSFETYRVSGKLIGEGDTSVQYVELFDVSSDPLALAFPAAAASELANRIMQAGDLAQAVRTAVINKRAGGMGLISGRKAFQKPVKEGVALLNAIQDVYLSKDVTIA